ncbi:hypothetical protein DMC01_10995 [Campylobacter troglodytis]|nr:hypothetical protein DMC01_10995 [Campylobacter troglodytis]
MDNAKRLKLSIEKQIKHLKDKGIKFELYNEKKATEFLLHHNYFFKIKAYCKNYQKNMICIKIWILLIWWIYLLLICILGVLF